MAPALTHMSQIYMATIDYMVAAYGTYAASATGGNGWARDFLAGLLTPYAKAYYESLGIFKASMILFGISFILVAAVFGVYFKGSALRARSTFAQRHITNQNKAVFCENADRGSSGAADTEAQTAVGGKKEEGTVQDLLVDAGHVELPAPLVLKS